MSRLALLVAFVALLGAPAAASAQVRASIETAPLPGPGFPFGLALLLGPR